MGKHSTITAIIVTSLVLMNAPGLVNNVLPQLNKSGLRLIAPKKIPEEPQFVTDEVLVRIQEERLPGSTAFKRGKAFSRDETPKERLRARKIRREVLQKRREVLMQIGARLISTHKLTPLAVYPMTGILRLKLPRGKTVVSVVKILNKDREVKYARRNSKVYPSSHIAPGTPNDKFWNQHLPEHNQDYSHLWGLEKIRMEEAWTDTRGGDIIVAVIDSGIDTTHPDLEPNLWTNDEEATGVTGDDDDGNCFIDDIHGVNLQAFNPECENALLAGLSEPLEEGVEPCMYTPQSQGDISDENGHGTHVAGIIGGTGNNQIPNDIGTTNIDESDQTGIVGVNWTVKLMGIKIFCIEEYNTNQAEPEMASSLGGVIGAIEYAIDMDAHIINASWIWPVGTLPDTLAPLLEAIQLAHDAYILFVTGAGNDASDNAINPRYPASFTADNIITVAATGYNDGDTNDGDTGDAVDGCMDVNDENLDCIWWDSNFSTSGTVHIAAPGWFIVSTFPPSLPLMPTGLDLGGACTPIPCTDPWASPIVAANGTSQAAPFVAGCAALLQAMRNSLSLPLLSPLDLKTLLIISGDQPRDNGNNLLLAGKTIEGRRLNCHEAIHSLPVCSSCMGTAGDPPEDVGVSP